jgi:hypothetical protein
MSSDRQSLTEFLNIDLDIRSHIGVEELLESIAGSVTLLHRAREDVSLEREDVSLELIEGFSSVEETILGWLEVIETLPIPAREIWNRCEFRRLNVGIQAGSEPYASSFAISSKTISMLAGLHLEVIFTVYAAPGSNAVDNGG